MECTGEGCVKHLGGSGEVPLRGGRGKMTRGWRGFQGEERAKVWVQDHVPHIQRAAGRVPGGASSGEGDQTRDLSTAAGGQLGDMGVRGGRGWPPVDCQVTPAGQGRAGQGYEERFLCATHLLGNPFTSRSFPEKWELEVKSSSQGCSRGADGVRSR